MTTCPTHSPLQGHRSRRGGCLLDGSAPNTMRMLDPAWGVIVNIDRVVVVTGVSSGIGYGVAKSLIAHQCHIFGRRALSLLPPTALLLGCNEVSCTLPACCIPALPCRDAPHMTHTRAARLCLKPSEGCLKVATTTQRVLIE